MILTKKPTPVPDVHVAAVGILSPGTVYVGRRADDDRVIPQLEDKKQAVLETSGGRLEALTVNDVSGGMNETGTYIDESDVAKFNSDFAKPTLRLYRKRDTFKKAVSRPGAVLLISTVLGLVAAGAAIYFAIAGSNATSAETVSARAQTALQWVVAPADRLDGRATGAEVAAARRMVHRRAVIASRCLDRLAGTEAPDAAVPGVTCKAESPEWYRNKDTLTWITLAVGLLTAAFATLALGDKFGFQKNPA